MSRLLISTVSPDKSDLSPSSPILFSRHEQPRFMVEGADMSVAGFTCFI